MPANTQLTSLTSGSVWAGWIITGLVVLFLAFDGVTKMINVAPVVEASEKLGFLQHTLFSIGFVLLACTAVYAIPPTAILGAILLTGYLGGAVAIHARVGSGAFPIIFSIGFGVSAWVGLVLREPRLLWTILLRQ
jgi:hypothetical protein